MKSICLDLDLDDLDLAISWISQSDPDAALKLDENLTKRVKRLEQFPYSGRVGRVEGTREAVIGNYVLVYAIVDDHLELLRFLHGARLYP